MLITYGISGGTLLYWVLLYILVKHLWISSSFHSFCIFSDKFQLQGQEMKGSVPVHTSSHVLHTAHLLLGLYSDAKKRFKTQQSVSAHACLLHTHKHQKLFTGGWAAHSQLIYSSFKIIQPIWGSQSFSKSYVFFGGINVDGPSDNSLQMSVWGLHLSVRGKLHSMRCFGALIVGLFLPFLPGSCSCDLTQTEASLESCVNMV